MSAPRKGAHWPQIWVLLVDVTEATEVSFNRFNLDDAPDHMYFQIVNNLTKNVWRYDNVHESGGIEGLAGLVNEEDDDKDDEENDAEMRAEEVLEYIQNKCKDEENPYNTLEKFEVLISLVLA